MRSKFAAEVIFDQYVTLESLFFEALIPFIKRKEITTLRGKNTAKSDEVKIDVVLGTLTVIY